MNLLHFQLWSICLCSNHSTYLFQNSYIALWYSKNQRDCQRRKQASAVENSSMSFLTWYWRIPSLTWASELPVLEIVDESSGMVGCIVKLDRLGRLPGLPTSWKLMEIGNSKIINVENGALKKYQRHFTTASQTTMGVKARARLVCSRRFAHVPMTWFCHHDGFLVVSPKLIIRPATVTSKTVSWQVVPTTFCCITRRQGFIVP